MQEREFGELMQMVRDVREDVKEIKSKIIAQNGRVRNLENWRSYTIGIGTILVFAIPILIKYIF